jgi:hypothetical protein
MAPEIIGKWTDFSQNVKQVLDQFKLVPYNNIGWLG